MGQLTVLGDWVGLVLVWLQPIFWMVFYHVKTTKFNWVIKPQFLVAFFLAITEVVPSGRAFLFSYINSHALLVMYSILATVFTLYLMLFKEWNYPQAISIAFLTVFIGSFYWGIPYLVRNAHISGPETDWLLHILFVFPVWYIMDTVGWRTDIKENPVSYLLLGLLISIVYMMFYPVDYGRMDAAIWDSWYYLSNRVIGTSIIFLLINKNEVPYPLEVVT